MSTSAVTGRGVRVLNRRWERVFFSGMAALMLGSVLVGFARTYFLAGMVLAPLPNGLIHVHGAVFTLWMVMYVVQTALIPAGQVKVHRTIGLGVFCLAIAMVVLGLLAAVDQMRRGTGGLPGMDPRTFFIFPVTDMLLFSVLVFSSYRMRRRPDAHKRLVLIATIALMGAAVGRWPLGLLEVHPMAQDLIVVGFLMLVVVYDLASLRRVHKATLWATGFFVFVYLVKVPVGTSGWWHGFAGWLMR